MKIISNKGWLLPVATLTLFAACKKSDEKVIVNTPPFQIGQPVSDAQPLCGSVKGTMLSGKTYTVSCNTTVNAGDTLLLQEDVHVNVTNSAMIIVKGTLISLGTSDKPNWITVPGVTKTDNTAAGASPATDPAFSGKWGGIACDTSCALFVMKWTHVEFAGATITSAQVTGQTAGEPSTAIFYPNINGTFVLEDSWIYGTADDAVRINSGKLSVMRNTFEKTGLTGGEALNIKSGAVGDVGYNVFVGSATNGAKLSNSGATAIQANINTFNNTFIDCGFRQIQSGRGGSLNYEKGVKGKVYNNLIVNCKYGFRVVNSADTNNTFSGNNYTYGDSLSIVNNIYPVGYVTMPQSTDIPAPSSFLPANYTKGMAYNGSTLVSTNNPQFRNFPLPNYTYISTNFTGGFDFHLQSSSPAIGKGNAGISPLSVVPADSKFGATEITAPGIDIGAYQTNGKGNQH